MGIYGYSLLEEIERERFLIQAGWDPTVPPPSWLEDDLEYVYGDTNAPRYDDNRRTSAGIPSLAQGFIPPRGYPGWR